MRINLFINWFFSDVRPQEFEYCLKKNMENPYIDQIFMIMDERPTFRQFFENMARYPNDCNIISNLDIYFDETVRHCLNIQPDVAYCLTRWEDDGKGNVISFSDKHYGHPGEWSQDAWVFTGTEILRVMPDFHLGQRGCDNHLAYLLKNEGFKLLNPSLDIKAIHCHNIDRNASTNRGERAGRTNEYIPVPITKLKAV